MSNEYLVYGIMIEYGIDLTFQLMFDNIYSIGHVALIVFFK